MVDHVKDPMLGVDIDVVVIEQFEVATLHDDDDENQYWETTSIDSSSFFLTMSFSSILVPLLTINIELNFLQNMGYL